MKANQSIIVTALLSVQASAMGLGVISYWDPNSGNYQKLPANSMAVINPNNGMFTLGSTDVVPWAKDYKATITEAYQKNVTMLGYVPIGYFNHDCEVATASCQPLAVIKAQVDAYLQLFPTLGGIFFDEASPKPWDCAAFAAEYSTLRDLFKDYKIQLAFNAGVPDNCAATVVEKDEIIVLFENTMKEYENQKGNVYWSTIAAHNRGAKVWHLVHTVPNSDAFAETKQQALDNNADWFFATNIGGDWQNGDNTWGILPSFWDDEINI